LWGGVFDVSPRAQVGGWLVEISRECVGRDRALSGRDLSEFVGCLVVASGDVDEFEAVELILESMYLLVVCLHFWVVAVGGFHHLVNEELGVASNFEATNSQLDGDLQPIDKGLVFRNVVRCRKVYPDDIPHMNAQGQDE